MHQHISFDRFDHTDLNMYQCGTEDCIKNHSWGPGLRDHFLIHYVLSGKGIFQIGDMTYHLEKGQGFLICPGIISYYKADAEKPWTYCWTGFHGLKAEYHLRQAGLSAEKPLFRYDKDDKLHQCFQEMIDTKAFIKTRETRLLSLLYRLLSLLIEASDSDGLFDPRQDRKEQYIKKAVEYIEMNYSRKTEISDIASHIGLDRSYLCTLFKRFVNMTPQEFLINYRINKACELMDNNFLTIGDISRSVGYEDPLLFSKIFKKVKGCSPRYFRKLAAEKHQV